MKLLLCGAVCLTMLTGCMTPPQQYSIERSRVYGASYDQVWSDLIAFLAQRNIPLKSIAKDSGVIYAEAMSFDQGQADCGSPGILQPIARVASINILVQPTGSQQRVTVNSRFIETRFNSMNYMTTQFECSSRGTVEQGILGAISSRSSTTASAQPAAAGVYSAADRDTRMQALQNTPGLTYEEYQRRYREIMAGQ